MIRLPRWQIGQTFQWNFSGFEKSWIQTADTTSKEVNLSDNEKQGTWLQFKEPFY